MINISGKTIFSLIVLMSISATAKGMEGVNLDDASLKASKPSKLMPAVGGSLISTALAIYSLPHVIQPTSSAHPQLKTSLFSVVGGIAACSIGVTGFKMIKKYDDHLQAYSASAGLNIHGAAAHNNSHGVKKWIELDNKNITLKNPEGRKPIHFAAAFGANDSLATLLKKTPVLDYDYAQGITNSIDTKDNANSRTPLVYAALGNHPLTCKLLLKAGANGSIEDAQGNNVYTVAQHNRSLAQMLQDVRNEQRGGLAMDVVIDIND